MPHIDRAFLADRTEMSLRVESFEVRERLFFIFLKIVERCIMRFIKNLLLDQPCDLVWFRKGHPHVKHFRICFLFRTLLMPDTFH